MRVGSGFQPAAGLLPGVSPRHEERRLKAGGRLKAWPHMGARYRLTFGTASGTMYAIHGKRSEDPKQNAEQPAQLAD